MVRVKVVIFFVSVGVVVVCGVAEWQGCLFFFKGRSGLLVGSGAGPGFCRVSSLFRSELRGRLRIVKGLGLSRVQGNFSCVGCGVGHGG